MEHGHQLHQPRRLVSPVGVIWWPVEVVGVQLVVGGPVGGLMMRMEDERARSLLQFMEEEGRIPSPEEELRRMNVIAKLKQIVLTWIKKVAWQRQLFDDVIRSTSATILTYGSYGLGVYDTESDIDALCVGPWFASSDVDFFVVLYNMLKNRKEVSEILCVKNARIPMMRFKFDGIPIDLPYAKLEFTSIPENVEVLNPMILHGVDETSWKSLSGVRVNFGILQLVPNVKEFQSLLRCVKLWAKKRGIHGNLFGYFGGVHLAILAAFICMRNPEATLSTLVVDFFSTFASWPWPMPVALPDGSMPFFRDSDVARSLMPIQLPCSPHEYCASNISKSTFYRINSELVRGRSLTKNLLGRDFDWRALFEPFLHHKKYSWFVKVWLSASNKDDLGDWIGWVKSLFPSLILKLEEVLGFCDPNPAEYTEHNYSGKSPDVVYYWGLHAHCNDSDINRVEQDFRTSFRRGYEGPLGQVELSIVPSSELSTATVNCNNVAPKERNACWRIPEYSPQQVPMYSQHLTSYLVGYGAK